ncbi:MAG TPA: hypothetical protein VG125_32450, partial [Pirellulales bacterium]|nr:hypothetical protein [Pirellulales bacterium]
MASPPDTPNSASPLWSAQRLAVEVDGPDGHLEVLVDKPFARVGRDQRSEVPISDGRLFPCHVYLHATDEGVYYVGLAPDVASGWLLPSEDVQVGPFRLRARLIDGKPDRPLPMDLQAKRTGVSQVPHLRAVSSSRAGRFTDLRL